MGAEHRHVQADLADDGPCRVGSGAGDRGQPLHRRGEGLAGDGRRRGGIGYHAPSHSLVFYYGDVEYWNGIVRIRRLSDRDTQLIEQQPDETVVMIEHA